MCVLSIKEPIRKKSGNSYICVYSYMCMFPAFCFRQRTCAAQGLLNEVLNET